MGRSPCDPSALEWPLSPGVGSRKACDSTGLERPLSPGVGAGLSVTPAALGARGSHLPCWQPRGPAPLQPGLAGAKDQEGTFTFVVSQQEARAVGWEAPGGFPRRPSGL